MTNRVIALPLIRREAHVILRAIASHNTDAHPDDRQPCILITERILRILSQEPEPQPPASEDKV